MAQVLTCPKRMNRQLDQLKRPRPARLRPVLNLSEEDAGIVAPYRVRITRNARRLQPPRDRISRFEEVESCS